LFFPFVGTRRDTGEEKLSFANLEDFLFVGQNSDYATPDRMKARLPLHHRQIDFC
jgi:hypothetical protein